MRRRVQEGEQPAPELLDYEMWCRERGLSPWADDSYDSWVTAREAWAKVHGWPGGDAARDAGEIGVVPDMPWDPELI